MARPRRIRREQERALRKQVARIERDAGALPGGTAEHPIDVASAAVIEPRARGTPCLRCEGQMDIRRDQATSTARGVLRQIDLGCRICHASRTLWFRIAPVTAN